MWKKIPTILVSGRDVFSACSAVFFRSCFKEILGVSETRKNKLGAFDNALILAGICDYNLIKVSSILPPRCKAQNIISLTKGAILPSAYASICSNTLGGIVSASVAIGIPADKSNVGVIMEHSSYNRKEETDKIVRNLAEIAMRERNIKIKKIESYSVEARVETNEFYCAFSTVSMW